MSVADVVTFVSVGIIGGAIIQYPLGYLSDLWDRRTVLLVTTAGAMLSALASSSSPAADPLANFVLVFIFGSFAMPLFSLSAAHANDRAGKGEFVLVNAALMLFYSFGAIGGPLAASYFMQRFGPQSLFIFSAGVYAIFIAHHPLPHGRPGRRAGRPARPLHGAAADLDDVCPAGPPQRRPTRIRTSLDEHGTARRGLTKAPPAEMDKRPLVTSR